METIATALTKGRLGTESLVDLNDDRVDCFGERSGYTDTHTDTHVYMYICVYRELLLLLPHCMNGNKKTI